MGLDLQLSADDGIINTNMAGATFTLSGAIDLNGHNLSEHRHRLLGHDGA